jgi:hypothetical protein
MVTIEECSTWNIGKHRLGAVRALKRLPSVDAGERAEIRICEFLSLAWSFALFRSPSPPPGFLNRRRADPNHLLWAPLLLFKQSAQGTFA